MCPATSGKDLVNVQRTQYTIDIKQKGMHAACFAITLTLKETFSHMRVLPETTWKLSATNREQNRTNACRAGSKTVNGSPL